MSVGFGFSVGDFIAGIEVVRDIISSLQASRGSASNYQDLAFTLFSLERALLEIKSLDLHTQSPQIDALKCAVTQCQRSIDKFLSSIRKYQPSLTAQGTGSKLRDGIKKIQWALCKKDDVAEFQTSLMSHVDAIMLLLLSVQLTASKIQSGQIDKNQASFISILKQYFSQMMETVLLMRSELKNNTNIVESISKSVLAVTSSQRNIYEKVLEISQYFTSISKQVLFEQPIYFEDAYGKHVSFNLQWVYSSEILLDWLKRRFEGVASQKIELGEFVLEDSRTKRKLDYTNNWHSVFHPGMHVTMDMLFRGKDLMGEYGNSCPSCGTECTCSWDQRVACSSCGTLFLRIQDVPSRRLVFRNSDIALKDARPSTAIVSLSDLKIIPTQSWIQEQREQMRCFKRLRLSLPVDQDQENIMLPNLGDLSKFCKTCSIEIPPGEPSSTLRGATYCNTCSLDLPPHSMAISRPEVTGCSPKRRGRRAPPGRCHSCNRAETPEWRAGPDSPRTLCNACGLHYAKLTRKPKRKLDVDNEVQAL